MPHCVFHTAHDGTMTKITDGCQQLSTNEREIFKNAQALSNVTRRKSMKLKTASCCDIGTQDTLNSLLPNIYKEIH